MLRLSASTVLAIVVVACASLLGASGWASGREPTAVTVDGLNLTARVEGRSFALAQNGRFRRGFLAGVNLGSTVPGTLPGEVAAGRADYDRWLPQMAALGARAVRVYTILRPAFYQALRSHNLAHPNDPIYLFQGVWIPEDRFVATANAYDPEVVSGFRSELRDAVAVVHGAATLPLRRGHAGGRFDADVSPWTAAYSIGVEWDPFATLGTNRKNVGRPAYHGRYITTVGSPSPMESWLASMLDWTATLEARRGISVPLTFTNWVTTDPLRHPLEPLRKEDLVGIDATHIRATRSWPAGFFASYHVYPYYPDFFSLEPALRHYRRWDGKIDPYAGYLHELRAHHGNQAVMVTEFGVPTSIGLAHHGPLGRDQGGHSEAAAGAIDAAMLDDIRHEGMAGGLLFEWVDEWFKFTWNTIDLEQPGERRQLWRNPLTNEEHFGVLTAEPGRRRVVTVDGRPGEWALNGSQVIAESRGAVREVRAVKDEEYLYLRLILNTPFLWRREPITLGFDVRPGGNRGLPGAPGVYPQAEVAVRVGRGDGARAYWAAWVDPIPFQYGLAHGYVPVRPGSLRVGSGVWNDPRLILDRPFTVPGTPVDIVSVGRLGFGPSDPRAPGFDDRHLVDGSANVLELRIPWSYLTF